MQNKQYNVELQRLQISQQELNIRKAAAAEKTDEDSFIVKNIRQGYFNMTGKQMDPLSAKNAVIMFRGNNPDVKAYFNAGIASSSVTGGDGTKPIISLSPYVASDLVGRGKVTNISPAMQQVGDQLITWRREFENPDVQIKYPHDPKDPTGRETAFNKYVSDKTQQTLTINPTGAGGIFTPTPLGQVTQLNKNLAGLPVWKNVLAPAAATGVNIDDPNVAFGVITSALQSNKLSYNDAIDAAALYAGGLDMNNHSRNFIAFGLPPAKSYNVPIRVPGSLGKTTVNLADSKTIATLINRVQAHNAAMSMYSNNTTD